MKHWLSLTILIAAMIGVSAGCGKAPVDTPSDEPSLGVTATVSTSDVATTVTDYTTTVPTESAVSSDAEESNTDTAIMTTSTSVFATETIVQTTVTTCVTEPEIHYSEFE